MKNSVIGENAADITVGAALLDFYEKNQMAPDGGANDAWVKLKFGPFYLPFPNTASRKEAVKYHDIHHLLTGYPTNWKGEAAVGAWEVASGCGNYPAAWIFDLGIFAVGLFLFPLAVFRGFIRGKRSGNFYHGAYTYEQILKMPVAEAKEKILLNNNEQTPARPNEILVFVFWWMIALLSSFTIFVAPVAFVVHCIVD